MAAPSPQPDRAPDQGGPALPPERGRGRRAVPLGELTTGELDDRQDAMSPEAGPVRRFRAQSMRRRNLRVPACTGTFYRWLVGRRSRTSGGRRPGRRPFLVRWSLHQTLLRVLATTGLGAFGSRHLPS